MAEEPIYITPKGVTRIKRAVRELEDALNYITVKDGQRTSIHGHIDLLNNTLKRMEGICEKVEQ